MRRILTAVKKCLARFEVIKKQCQQYVVCLQESTDKDFYCHQSASDSLTDCQSIMWTSITSKLETFKNKSKGSAFKPEKYSIVWASNLFKNVYIYFFLLTSVPSYSIREMSKNLKIVQKHERRWGRIIKHLCQIIDNLTSSTVRLGL